MRDALENVIRRLAALPRSADGDVLCLRAEDDLAQVRGWQYSHPTRYEREALMKRVLALHVAVANLEQGIVASTPHGLLLAGASALLGERAWGGRPALGTDPPFTAPNSIDSARSVDRKPDAVAPADKQPERLHRGEAHRQANLRLRCPRCGDKVRRAWTDWVVFPLFIPCLAGCAYWWLSDSPKGVFGFFAKYLPIIAAMAVLAMAMDRRRCSCGWRGPADACRTDETKSSVVKIEHEGRG
jgi:hypothetical protein